MSMASNACTSVSPAHVDDDDEKDAIMNKKVNCPVSLRPKLHYFDLL